MSEWCNYLYIKGIIMYIEKNEIEALLSKRELYKEENHCIAQVINEIKQEIEKVYLIEAKIEYGEKIVSTNDNYYALGYDANEITVSKKYTKYINENTILRTQMSSAIPKLMRNYDRKSDEIWVCPGIVYRRDVRDKTHVGEPHQLDIWYLTKEKQNRENLLGLVKIIISIIERHKKIKIKWRYKETSHHYTNDGIEVEIYHNGQWLEILECGLIGKKLLEYHNLENYYGLALGLGLERLVMIIKEIDDIRLLYSHKIEIANQMTNLKKYQQVSNQPTIKRDLSIAIEENVSEEELTELILNLLEENIEKLIESIKVLSITKYQDLPEIAKERLGIQKGYNNILLRIVLRDLEKSITNEEANMIYRKIYSKIHKGEKGYII